MFEQIPENRKIIRQLADVIDANDNFLLTTHVRSDPDGLSSEIALFHLLTNLGKKALIINDSKFPELLRFLLSYKDNNIAFSKEPDKELRSLSTPSRYILKPSEYSQQNNINFEAVITLDTPNIKRLGGTSDIIPKNATLINIDHHISNERFGDINWVQPDASSTGEMIYDYFKETRQEITREIAKALYTSIITDTGRFVHANTTPKCLLAASDLIEHGANPSEIAKYLFQTNTYGVLKLQSMAINSLKLEAEGQIGVIWLTKDMLKNSGSNDEIDTQVFIDIPSSIETVLVGILLKELEESNDIKISLRSKNNIDVNRIAKRFGGGGHLMASGCEIAGSIEEVHAKIVEEVKKDLNYS